MSNYSKPDQHYFGVASRKRKERDTSTSAVMANKPTAPTPPPTPPCLSKSPAASAPSSKDNNWLLAGYLAHEFLTSGTLLGQKWDPARAEANPITPRNNIPNIRGRPTALGVGGAPGSEAKSVRPQQKIHSSYADVSKLLKSDGAHIEGVVNPTQLAKWLHL